METSRIRVEIIRFALLLVVTVALISVATRINDNDGARTAGARPTDRATSAPSGDGSSTSGGASSPGTGPSSPDQTSSPAGGGTSSPDGTSSPGDGQSSADSTGSGDGSRSGGGSGSDGGATSAPTLPRTGNDQPLRLLAVAFLLIGAGSLSISVSRR